MNIQNVVNCIRSNTGYVIDNITPSSCSGLDSETGDVIWCVEVVAGKPVVTGNNSIKHGRVASLVSKLANGG